MNEKHVLFLNTLHILNVEICLRLKIYIHEVYHA